jgi:hypothetical protein
MLHIFVNLIKYEIKFRKLEENSEENTGCYKNLDL